MVTKYSKDPQRNGTNHGIDIIYWTVLSAGLWPSASIWRRDKRFLLSFLHGKSHAIGQCNCHLEIPVDILGHFNKIVEQYNRFKASWLVKMITCKNAFVLLFHKCLKRWIYAIFVLLFLCDFNLSWKATKAKVECTIFISRIALQKFRFDLMFHQNWWDEILEINFRHWSSNLSNFIYGNGIWLEEDMVTLCG